MSKFCRAHKRCDLQAVVCAEGEAAPCDRVLAERRVLMRPVLQFCTCGRQFEVHVGRLTLLSFHLRTKQRLKIKAETHFPHELHHFHINCFVLEARFRSVTQRAPCTRAGHEPCRPVSSRCPASASRTTWRTVGQLGPLLKANSQTFSFGRHTKHSELTNESNDFSRKFSQARTHCRTFIGRPVFEHEPEMRTVKIVDRDSNLKHK